MKSITFISLFALVVLSGSAAYASRGDTASIASIKHDLQDPPAKLKLVKISGSLTCDMGSENNGQACELKLHETGTGKIFNLTAARSAMQLFQDGSRNVTVEGRLADSETLEVKNAQAL